MKYILFLLITASVFAQREKDSLLARDHDKVIRQLDMMRYLDSIAMDGVMHPEKRDISRNYYRYYLDTIVGHSPFGFRETADYLGYKTTTGPATWKDFSSRVAEKNIDAAFALTEKYGYIDNRRLKQDNNKKDYSLLLYVCSSSKYDKEFKKMLKQEFKIGNMHGSDYEFFKFLVQRKTIVTPEEIKELEKRKTKYSGK
jgi:uncharacterized protein (DUF885 family)